jgi:hypothetical protein
MEECSRQSKCKSQRQKSPGKFKNLKTLQSEVRRVSPDKFRENSGATLRRHYQPCPELRLYSESSGKKLTLLNRSE